MNGRLDEDWIMMVKKESIFPGPFGKIYAHLMTLNLKIFF